VVSHQTEYSAFQFTHHVPYGQITDTPVCQQIYADLLSAERLLAELTEQPVIHEIVSGIPPPTTLLYFPFISPAQHARPVARGTSTSQHQQTDRM
jgi:hypothetical protein